MKIFLDTNVVLDYLTGRPGISEAVKILCLAGGSKDRKVCTSYLTIANSAYILRKTHDNAALKTVFRILTSFCDVLPMDDMQIYDVIRSGSSPDFEDNLQIMCAEYGGCDVIVTHNVGHFRPYTDIPVLSPEDFVGRCG